MMGDARGRSPFTASQWQQLEHQALVFNYMASGTPMPQDLRLPIRSSWLEAATNSAAPLLPRQSSGGALTHAPPVKSLLPVGCGYHQKGFGRKGENPEPGRCRRTDGKKWRCSKEAHPGSKYCERHMHRGKNRSRKHGEAPIGTTSAAAAVAATAPYAYNTTSTNHHPGHPLSSASRDAATGYPPRSSSPRFNLDTASSSADRDHCREPRKLDFHAYIMHNEDESEKRRHCFVLGADLKLEWSAKAGREEEPPQPFHHFFADNGHWPSDNKDPWVDQEEDRSEHAGWGGLPQDQALHASPTSPWLVTGSTPRTPAPCSLDRDGN